MPGDLALLLGAPPLVAQGRRALPPLADRVLLADVARKHPGYFAPVAETPGFGEALFRLVRELRGAGYDLSELGPLLDGATDAPEKAGSLAEILAEFERRRSGFYGPDDALLAADPAGSTGSALLVWGMLDLPPALERLLHGIAERMPVDVYLPDVPAAADAPAGRAAATADRRRGRRAAAGRVRARTGSALERVRRAMFTPPAKPAIAADGTPAAGVGARSVARGPGGRAGVPSVGARGGAVLGHGGRLPARRGLPAAGRGGVRRGRDPRVPARGLAAGRAAARPPDARAAGAVRQRPLAPVGDGLPHRRASSRTRCTRSTAGSRPRAGTRSRARPASSRAPSSGSAGSSAVRAASEDDERGACRTGCSSAREDAGRLARFIAELDRRLRERPARATWAEHLDYLQGLLARYVDGAEEVVVALRGLERFTALEAEVDFDWFLDVVRRAIGTLRSEDVIDSRPGAFAARGVNIVAVNSLVGIEFARVWILGATERVVPAARAPGPDPARRRARDDLASARRRRSRRGRRAAARRR